MDADEKLNRLVLHLFQENDSGRDGDAVGSRDSIAHLRTAPTPAARAQTATTARTAATPAAST